MTYRTPPQRAKQLGVSPDRVRNWISTGELAAINLGDGDRPRWRISDEAIDAFLAARANQPPTPIPPRRKRQTAVREYF